MRNYNDWNRRSEEERKEITEILEANRKIEQKLNEKLDKDFIEKRGIFKR